MKRMIAAAINVNRDGSGTVQTRKENALRLLGSAFPGHPAAAAVIVL
jgi:hypothetical protein